MVRVILLSVLALFSCAAAKNSNTSIPKVDVKVYQGFPDMGAIVRTKDKEVIACIDPRFSNFQCFSAEDLRKVIKAYIMGCKEWK